MLKLILKGLSSSLPPSLTLGPVNASDRQSSAAVRYRTGNGLYCIPPLPSSRVHVYSGNSPQLETKCIRPQRIDKLALKG